MPASGPSNPSDLLKARFSYPHDAWTSTSRLIRRFPTAWIILDLSVTINLRSPC